MSIYLIRHTTPLIEKGTCYGQSDLDVTEQFLEEAGTIQPFIPGDLEMVYSSPLIRCSKLATQLFPGHNILFDHNLKEIHCGEWEMLRWDDIPRDVIDPWMKDFVNVTIPGGESYVDLHTRVTKSFDAIAGQGKRAAIVAHGGVLRSILAHITGTALADSFNAFHMHYGCVIRIDRTVVGLQYEILHNTSSVKEQHKPSYK